MPHELRALLHLSRIDEHLQAIADEHARTGRELQSLELKRALLETSISPARLERYHAALREGLRPPVAIVDHGTCGGCHAVLDPEAVRQADAELIACPRCGRLLCGTP